MADSDFRSSGGGGPRPLTRRRFVGGLGVLVGGVAAGVVGFRSRSPADGSDGPLPSPTAGAGPSVAPLGGPGTWSDPSSWSDGRIPGAGDVAVVDRSILLDHDVRVAGVDVTASGHLRFDETRRVTLTSHGNVVVRGHLTMKPADEAAEHVLRFVDIDESTVVGGPAHHPLDTDVGLWVVADGQVEAVGAARAGWNRTGTDRTWRDGDEILVAPSGTDDSSTFAPHSLGAPAPTVTMGDVAVAAEVFNLSRNVRIEGTPSGRAHVIFLECTRPQTVRYVALRHVGPRPGAAPADRGSRGPDSVTATGRYGLHFHHCRDGSRGSVVEGVVVRDCGGHAFVPHGSHGITFEDCVAYSVAADAYWWDPEPDHGSYPDNASHDVAYRHCAAFDLEPGPDDRGFQLTGFYLGQGENNSCVDCVTAGCRGPVNASGFHWPSTANGMPGNVWTFEDCVAHNNTRHGIFVWQNDSNEHVVERFTAWRNGGSGINHGAYLNRYSYSEIALLENATALTLHAGGRGGGATVFERVTMADPLRIAGHPVPFEGPARLVQCSFPGPILVEAEIGDRPTAPGDYEFVDCLVDGHAIRPEDFEFLPGVPEGRFRVQEGDAAYELDRDGVVEIAPFLH